MFAIEFVLKFNFVSLVPLTLELRLIKIYFPGTVLRP